MKFKKQIAPDHQREKIDHLRSAEVKLISRNHNKLAKGQLMSVRVNGYDEYDIRECSREQNDHFHKPFSYILFLAQMSWQQISGPFF